MHFDEEEDDIDAPNADNYAKIAPKISRDYEEVNDLPVIPLADYDDNLSLSEEKGHVEVSKQIPYQTDNSFLTLYDRAGPNKPQETSSGGGRRNTFGYLNKTYEDFMVNGLV